MIIIDAPPSLDDTYSVPMIGNRCMSHAWLFLLLQLIDPPHTMHVQHVDTANSVRTDSIQNDRGSAVRAALPPYHHNSSSSLSSGSIGALLLTCCEIIIRVAPFSGNPVATRSKNLPPPLLRATTFTGLRPASHPFCDAIPGP